MQEVDEMASQMTTETTTPQVTIKRVEGGPDALYCNYPGQNGVQGCFIALDLRDGSMWASYNAEIGNAVPSSVWHGIVRRYAIPVLQPATVNALMEQILPHAQTVLDHSEIEWDGSNHVARLDSVGETAEDEIKNDYGSGTLDQLESDVYFEDASDWLGEVSDELRSRLAAGDSVELLAAEYNGDGSSEDRPIVDGIERYLDGLR